MSKQVKLLNDAEKLMTVNQWKVLNDLMDALDNEDELSALVHYDNLRKQGIEIEFTYQ